MKKLCLDPGHGGHDPGAVGPTGLKESAVALEICKRIKQFLHGTVDVVLTRDDGTFLTLTNRATIANARGADAFLSVHLNAANGRAHGFEVFTTKGRTKADAFATSLFNSYKDEFQSWVAREDTSDGDPDKEAQFTVLTKTKMPAALFECAFIDHPETEQWLRDHDNIDRIAHALCDGILHYFDIEGSGLIPSPQPDPETRSDLERALQNCNEASMILRSLL